MQSTIFSNPSLCTIVHLSCLLPAPVTLLLLKTSHKPNSLVIMRHQFLCRERAALVCLLHIDDKQPTEECIQYPIDTKILTVKTEYFKIV